MIAAFFEVLFNQSFLLDTAGLMGLGLVAVGAIRLAERYHSLNAPLMIWGAIALILGRLGILAYTEFFHSMSGMSAGVRWVAVNVPMVLLTLGVGLIVAGFWLHEKEVDSRFEPPVS
ncbi:hypothetical protein HNR46_000614 [Haloferula luteola]|uniref:Uncharacterized protein n=1 Tax=Haloferula luteola TaxID=595692 RepID=A0A840V8V5_9BACT|nr:hypothetical protein [Haloferula luteola]MBB5350390.1 hypothetical protein [Haloferula luteola]